MYVTLDLVTGPTNSEAAPGSGAELCTCGNHRRKCLFGRSHNWQTAYFGGVLLATKDTWHCVACGSVCDDWEDSR